ncbi:hypothetical protein CYLTODRAFT_485668 [Cylindrobasidium torrendii FP15055 ss-10]|uniref:DUF3835 domain-containing protein n=1 Tax=Cylindrobasidium torrendii FP15055 ss-10 TaxID=1314674 RepID=A0A0D7BUE9_9AGAR|nr:hypothetical protein CYLTODRAFT_485668 [Cylindrobasidium torrendii FP15055 ss-10]
MSGSTTNLSESGAEAFKALLNTVAPGAEGKLSEDALHRLSDRYKQLVGDKENAQNILAGLNGGELTNEEGLPIVDINEEVTEDGSRPIGSLEEPEIAPIASLPLAELEARRRERDSILDRLEAEEEEAERHDNEAAIEQRRHAIEMKRELERKEVERLAKQKAMQKKMGKALLKSIVSDEQEIVVEGPEPKKKVAFADASDVEETGDVYQGRLTPASKRPTLVSHLRSDQTLPMRIDVVERTPGPAVAPQLEPEPYIDSDDESNPPTSDSELEGDSDEEFEEGEDLDYARHQREILLEYHRKRDTIGQDVAAAMTSHTHSHDEDVPVPPTRRSVSRFQSERLAASYNTSTSSTSLGSIAVLPVSGAETVQTAIKVGKVDSDGQLVSGPGDDDDTSDAELQEVLELIRKGEIYNAGPHGHPKLDPTKPRLQEEAPVASSEFTGLPPITPKPKVSRFKASRPLAVKMPSETNVDASLQSAVTPVNTLERSSPKLSQEPSLKGSPLGTPSSSSKPFSLPPDFDRSYLPVDGNPMSMVVESPSFPSNAAFSQPVQSGRQAMGTNVMERLAPTMRAGVVERGVMNTGVMERSPAAIAGIVERDVVKERQEERERLRPSRPPTISSSASNPPQKMSRFKAGRM